MRHCQHAVKLSARDPVQVPVLEALADLCSRCVHAVELPDGVEVLWRALDHILIADARARALAEVSGPRTWPAYARALEEAARHDDAAVRSLLRPVLDHEELGAQGWQALRVWTAVVERSEDALSAYRAAAPSAAATTSVTAACDAVAAERAVHEESRALGAVLGDGLGYGYGRPSSDLWTMVRRAWSMAREQGHDAAGAVEFATSLVCREWGTARVRDVSALPLPTMTCAGGHRPPAAWAEHEYRHQWDAFVRRWCARLEAALTQEPVESQKRQLLLVCGWPLTGPDDGDLAYLSQYDQVGPCVPWRGADRRYTLREDRRQAGAAVVLAVPEFAAERALANVRGQPGRLLVGSSLEESDLQSAEEPASGVLAAGAVAHRLSLAGGGPGRGRHAAPPLGPSAPGPRGAARAARHGWSGSVGAAHAGGFPLAVEAVLRGGPVGVGA
ncbi:hypothetical protein AB0B04_32135 [Streptomyces xinghaiensis]|uniref:hypothetical protein n=1 Tax=Streptomyces TaxID=1883 RepID=UPI0011B27825|nr:MULTISPECIES: hypothetical protein [Streptomyces]